MIYFTSDIHFGHTNIIKYCKRPFLFDTSLGWVDKNLDVRTMDQAIIDKWNAKVKPGDTVYIIGDFAFYKDPRQTSKVFHSLNGTKHLVKGNHDRGLTPELLDKFASVHSYLELNIPDKSIARGKQMIVMSHYAFRVWNKSHHGSWNLYGHSHGSLSDDPNALAIDVGIDCHNYEPISYDEVRFLCL